MVHLEWWCLTDDELYAILDQKREQGVKQLKIHGYKAESLLDVPLLTDYIQFNLLTHLDLSWNRITEFPVDCVAPGLEILNMSHNALQILPPLVKFTKLREVNFSHNRLLVVYPDQPGTIQLLDVSYNQLQAVPPLNRITPLREVNLGHNRITQLTMEQFPVNIEMIDLSHNALHAPPVLGKLANLRLLDLSDNRLTVVSPVFPASLEVIKLSGNQLNEIPSMLKTNVKEVYIERTGVRTLLGLSPVCKAVYQGTESAQSNGIISPTVRVLKEECFPSKSVYHMLQKTFGEDGIRKLQQPAPEVFNLGYQSVLRYFKEQLIPSSWNTLILVGDKGSGKTSLLRSLIKGRPSLTGTADITGGLRVKSWRLDSKTVFQVYDHGSLSLDYKDSSHILNHVLAPPSPTATVFILHNLSQSNFNTTYKTLQTALMEYPKGNLHFVLTHSDKFTTQAYTEEIDKFQNRISSLLQQEISMQEKLEPEKRNNEILKLIKEFEESGQYFVVSCKTYSGVQDVRDYLTQISSANTVLIPDLWVHVYNTLLQQHAESQFVRLSEVEDMLRQLATIPHHSKTTTVRVHDCLQFLTDIGMIMWRGEHFMLKHYVFHRPQYVLDLCRELLQAEGITPDGYDDEGKEDMRESFTRQKYNDMVNVFCTQGLLQGIGISYLWQHHDLSSQDAEAMLELAKYLHLCYPVLITGVRPRDMLYYFPSNVISDEIPSDLDPAKPMIVDNDLLSLCVEFACTGEVLMPVAHMMCVELQRYAVGQQYKGHRKSWGEGLMVKVNTMECFVFCHGNKLKLCVRGPPNDAALLWGASVDMYRALCRILSHFPTLNENTICVVCPHCVYTSITPPHKWKAYFAFSGLVVDKNGTVQCPNGDEEDIPVGLVQYFNNNDSRKLNQLCSYLEDNWTAVPREHQLPLAVKTYLRSRQSVFAAIMCVAPVLQALAGDKMISEERREQLSGLPPNKQVTHLFERWLLRQSADNLQEFKQVLVDTDYHTNVTLSHMLPEQAQEKDIELDLPEEILTESDLDMIRDVFIVKLLDSDVDIDMCISHLYSTGTLHTSHHEELHTLKTTHAKITCLVEGVLLRGTFHTVVGFKNALKACNAVLLDDLPQRPGYEETGLNHRHNVLIEHDIAQQEIKTLDKVKQTKTCSIL